MILEIWGNGKDVIIKYKKDIGGVWYTASAWMKNNGDLNDKFLIKNGYRRITL